MKLSLPPKLVEKLDWVPVILFCKIFRRLMPYYAETSHSGPHNRLTSRITLNVSQIVIKLKLSLEINFFC